jgi:hypothetical protein
MTVYVVELEMSAAPRGGCLTWLAGHVQEMPRPGFHDAAVVICADPPPVAGGFIVMANAWRRTLETT